MIKAEAGEEKISCCTHSMQNFLGCAAVLQEPVRLGKSISGTHIETSATLVKEDLESDVYRFSAVVGIITEMRHLLLC